MNTISESFSPSEFTVIEKQIDVVLKLEQERLLLIKETQQQKYFHKIHVLYMNNIYY